MLPLNVAMLPFKAAGAALGLAGRLLRGGRGLDLNADGAAAAPRAVPRGARCAARWHAAWAGRVTG